MEGVPHLQLDSPLEASRRTGVVEVADAHPQSQELVVRVYSVEEAGPAQIAEQEETGPNRVAVVGQAKQAAVREALAKSA